MKVPSPPPPARGLPPIYQDVWELPVPKHKPQAVKAPQRERSGWYYFFIGAAWAFLVLILVTIGAVIGAVWGVTQ